MKTKLLGLILSTVMTTSMYPSHSSAAIFDWSSGNYNTSGSPTTINAVSVLNVIDSSNNTKILNRDIFINGTMNIDASFGFDETSYLNLNSGSNTYINDASLISTGIEFGGIINEGFLTKSFNSVSNIDYTYNSITSTGKITSLTGELSFLKDSIIANNSVNLTDGNVSFNGSFNTFNNVSMTSAGIGILSFNNYNQYTGLNFNTNNVELRAGYHESFSSIVSGYVNVKQTGAELSGSWTIANGGTIKFNSGAQINLTNAQILNHGEMIVDTNVFISSGTVITNAVDGKIVLNNQIVSSNPSANYISNSGQMEMNGQLNTVGFNNAAQGILNVSNILTLQSSFINYGTIGSSNGQIIAIGQIVTNQGLILIGKNTSENSNIPVSTFSKVVQSIANPIVLGSLSIDVSSFDNSGEIQFFFNSDNGTYSQLYVLGSSNLSGIASISCLEGCNPLDGSYQIMNATGGIIGMFDTFTIDPNFSSLNGKNYSITYDSNSVYFNVSTPVPPPIPEPKSGVLLLAGLAAIIAKSKRA